MDSAGDQQEDEYIVERVLEMRKAEDVSEAGTSCPARCHLFKLKVLFVSITALNFVLRSSVSQW